MNPNAQTTLQTKTKNPFTFPSIIEEESTTNKRKVSSREETLPTPKIQASNHDHNINQSLITVTEDKALICLNRNLKNIGRKRWAHPLSLFISLLLALATSEFDKLTWISPYLLKATFIVAAILTAGWLVWEIMHAGKLKEIPLVVKDIFEELRGKESSYFGV